MQMTGAQNLDSNACLEQGVDTVFGYPGGTILNVYDALYRLPAARSRHILTAHEQGAAHAADGYARGHRQGGRVLRHLRPRRYQPHHRHRHGLYGLLARGVHLLQTSTGDLIGTRRLSGGRHHRHHHAHHQVQLHGAATWTSWPTPCATAFAIARQRPARPGPHRHHPRT